ncbi:MAG: hypothetical protein IIB55_06105, partial [Planctomycetes bacterium]|nr:hypothetical protein [Planctomycetota bacterium]
MHATRELGLTEMGAALSAGFVLMCGCAQQSGVDDRAVTASDFRSGLIGPPAEFDRARAGIGPEMSRLDPSLGFDTRLGERAVLDIAVVTGPPGPGNPSASVVERPVLVEEKVGEINGTPVFAGEFFDEQFAGRLRADALTKAPEVWLNDAARDIRRKLNTLVQESLLTQEGRSHLTPEQQQNLFLWLNKWEKDLQSRHMGSVQLTERALNEDGRTLAQWRDERERWRNSELPARDAMKVFERLYELHGRLEREAERLDLVIGDGLLSWQRDEGSVFHPVLLQRVQLLFDPKTPQFTV